jgi:uracil-DNA glycosylase family 4
VTADADGFPITRTPGGVVRAAAGARDLAALDTRVSGCRACPRLVAWREEVALVKRASFRSEDYWGRPVPGLGPADARIAVVGLAPAAHGGNRTGRVFTGDRSGDWIFAALWRAGLANQPTSTHVGDGLELTDVRVAAAVRCAPPANAPTPEERDTCSPWLARELALLPRLRVVVVLGGFGWTALWPVLGAAGYRLPRPRPAFGHGVEVDRAGRSPCWAATTSASRTPSPAGSPNRCSTPSSRGPRSWRGRSKAEVLTLSAGRPGPRLPVWRNVR